MNWIEINESWHEFSWSKRTGPHPMLKPGVLIVVEYAGKIKKHLIGDINTLGGLCDDCSLPYDAIVKQAAVVWEDSDE